MKPITLPFLSTNSRDLVRKVFANAFLPASRHIGGENSSTDNVGKEQISKFKSSTCFEDIFSGKIFSGVLISQNEKGKLPLTIVFSNGKMGYCVDKSRIEQLPHDYKTDESSTSAICEIYVRSFGISFTDRIYLEINQASLNVKWFSETDGKLSDSYFGNLKAKK